MQMRRLILVVASVGLLCSLASAAQARSLRDKVDTLFGEQGIVLMEPSNPSFSHAAHFESSTFITLGNLVESLAANAADFNVVSTTPGFVYRYNPDLKVFERSPGSLGPVFAERAETVGNGAFDVGMSYLYVDYSTLNGDSLDSLSFETKHTHIQGDPPFTNDTVDLAFTKFSLTSQVFSFYGTYGLTDRWDANVLVPVVYTTLSLHGRGTINRAGPGSFFMGTPIHQFTSTGKCASANADNSVCEASDRGDHLGVGDILLRTKYRFTDAPGFNYAVGLVLRLPSGNQDDFQGLGDTTVEPLFVMSRQFELPWDILRGPHDFHLNLGIEANTGDVNRSRGRYALGVTTQLTKVAAFFVDLIGSSGLTDQTVSTTVPTFSDQFPCPNPANPSDTCNPNQPTGSETREQRFRTDIVDLALGFKEQVLSSTTVFVGAVVPLNHDGLRADVIPTTGIEVAF